MNKQQKLLWALPLLVVPFLTLAFYALGGGKTKPGTATQHEGLNTSLPSAQFDKHEKPKDKMSFYDQARLDSAKAQSGNGNPFLRQMGFNTKSTAAAADPAATMVQIDRKLADLNRQISRPQSVAAPKPVRDKTLDAQVSKLETLMKTMNSSQDSDPQMQQLSKMLQQIQDIQHPELVKAVVKSPPTNTDSLFKAIPASIDGNQKVLQGGIVRLRLNDTIRIKGKLLPIGQLLFGNANITNQRLLLNIKNIRIGNAIIPADLSVYSLDGLPGINAPDAELAGATGEGANNAVESMQFLSMDPSLATQAAAGGIQAAKGLFTKKVRRIKVKLKGGYPILLRNNNLK